MVYPLFVGFFRDFRFLIATLCNSLLNRHMPNIIVPTNPIILTDYDFTVNRPRTANLESPDGTVTIRMPGKDRKTANHELVFLPYFKKHKLKFKTVAIGRSKKKKQTSIVAFDQTTLGQESAIIRKYQKIGGIVNSKAHALKILEIFKIPIPSRADEVLKVYFRLQPTVVNRNKLNYHICNISLLKIKQNELQKEKGVITRGERKRKKILPSNSQKNDLKEPNTESNIL